MNTNIDVHSCMYINRYVYLYACVCVSVCVCVNVHMCVHIYVCMCVCVDPLLSSISMQSQHFKKPDDMGSKSSSKAVRQNSLTHCLFHFHTISLCSSSIHSPAPCLQGEVK